MTAEVAHFIAGNIAKRISEMVKCEECENQLIEARDLADTSRNAYLSDLSRGELSKITFRFVPNGYALLDQYI